MYNNTISTETIADQPEVIEAASPTVSPVAVAANRVESGDVVVDPIEVNPMSEPVQVGAKEDDHKHVPASSHDDSTHTPSNHTPSNHTPDVRLLAKAVTNHLGGRSEEALRDLDAALRNGDSSDEVLAARGYLQLELGRYEEALKTYRKALEQAPGDPGLAFHTGLALQYLDRHSDALPCFEQALKGQPGWLGAQVSLGICP